MIVHFSTNTLIAIITVGTVNIAVSAGSSTMAYFELDIHILNSCILGKDQVLIPQPAGSVTLDKSLKLS